MSIELDGHGVFTRAIIDALTAKGNARGNRLLKFGNFRAAVTENVRKLTDGNQMPIVEMRENFDEFVIASIGPS